ncbi:MAG: helix-turn-helix domain-containing protein [Tagaea sp.]|nr:helix-turn-helix domain-containing protein [Tagaea sp.]
MQFDLLEPDELAEALRVTTGTLAKWRLAGGGPRFVKLPKSVLYDRSDVTEWLESQKMRTTADHKGT